MTDRLDKLFDAARLRQRWQSPPKPEAPPAPALEIAPAREEFEALKIAIREELGAETDRLDPLLATIEGFLAAFDTVPNSELDRDEARAAIAEQVRDLDELILLFHPR